MGLRLTLHFTMVVTFTAIATPATLTAQSATSLFSDQAAAVFDGVGADPQKLQLFCRLYEVWKKTTEAYRDRPVFGGSVASRALQREENQRQMLRELGAVQAEQREIAAQIGPEFEQAWSAWRVIGNLPEAGNFRVAMFKLIRACEPGPSKDQADR